MFSSKPSNPPLQGPNPALSSTTVNSVTPLTSHLALYVENRISPLCHVLLNFFLYFSFVHFALRFKNKNLVQPVD